MEFPISSVIAAVLSPNVLRPIGTVLRTFAPILVVGKYAVVTRHADVVDVLARDEDFTISQINAEPIHRHDGPFILGMDRGPEYDRNVAVLRRAVRSEDLERIGTFVRDEAARCLTAARNANIVDVVDGYARLVAVRLVANYFGMPGPDERTMMGWLRDIFYDVFLNQLNNGRVSAAAHRSGVELQAHMTAVIARRKASTGGPESGSWPNGDVLHRLIDLQGPEYPWLDDDTVRRNLSGLIVGAVDTTSKFVTLAIHELLLRPDVYRRARNAALAGDLESVGRYAYEAARFNPQTPLLFRYCAKGAELAPGTRRAKWIPAGTTVLIGTLSAMFDAAAFRKPRAFRPDHDSASLHFGGGLHRCFGLAINDVVIPALIAELLALPRLRPAAGGAGAIRWQGPFPDRYLLEFN